MHNHKLELGILLALVLWLSIPPLAYAELKPTLSVTLEEELTLTPWSENQLLRSQTNLVLGISISGIELESETGFGGNVETPGLNTQRLNLDYTGEKYSANFNAVFNPENEGLDFMIQEVELTEEIINLTNRLLLENVSDENSYGAGFEIELSGRTNKDVRISAAIRFGMDEYLKEVYDPSVEGSGYYIITSGKAGPSQFPFGSALIEISDVGFGPCTITNRTKFMRNEGFLFSGFIFDLIDKGPWQTRSYIFFNNKEKTISLVPTFQFGEDTWNVVADFGEVMEDSKASTLDKLVIRGIKFSGLSMGNLEISGTSALGGKMKKEKGADQLELHAKDYKLSRSFDEIARNYMFEKVDWSDVITIEYDQLDKENLERYLALDWYLKRGGAKNFFGVNSVNAVSRWELNSTFSFGTGVSLKSGKGLKKIVLNLVHNF